MHIPTVKLNNTKLKFVQSIKYLGVFLNDQCDDNDDLLRHRKYLYARGNALIARFKDCSNEVKTRLFRTFCNNAYGGHLWSRYSDFSMHKLNVAFNDIYRKLFGVKRGVSMSDIYVRSNIDCLRVVLRKASYRFRKCVLLSSNIFVRFLTTSVFFYKSSLSSLWTKELFMKM